MSSAEPATHAGETAGDRSSPRSSVPSKLSDLSTKEHGLNNKTSTEPATPAGEGASDKSSPLSSVPSNLSDLNPSNEEHIDDSSSGSEGEDDSRKARHASTPSSKDGGLPRLLGSLTLGDNIKTCSATSFDPPSKLKISSSEEVFEGRDVVFANGSNKRFTLRKRHVPGLGPAKTIAIYIGGAAECTNFQKVEVIPRPIGDLTRPNNFTKVYVRQEKGGCAFIYRPGEADVKSLALECEGPDGKTHKRTETRAELRAALAALHYEDWYSEGWEQVVLITSCKYVADHATTSLPRWWERNWLTKNGHTIKNQDLWKELSRVVCEFAKHGCKVSFWRVPDAWNYDAIEAAGKAVADPEGEGFAM